MKSIIHYYTVSSLCVVQLAPERPLARAVGHPHNVEQIGMPKYGTAWQSTKLSYIAGIAIHSGIVWPIPASTDRQTLFFRLGLVIGCETNLTYIIRIREGQ